MIKNDNKCYKKNKAFKEDKPHLEGAHENAYNGCHNRLINM